MDTVSYTLMRDKNIGPKDPGKEILIMTVEYSAGKRDQITIHENDIPHDLAAVFCAKHGIDSSVVDTLTRHIVQNVQKLTPARKEQREEVKPADKGNVKPIVRPMAESAENRPTVTYTKQAGTYGSLECGQRLYYKGLKITQDKKRKVDQIKAQLEQEEGKELTFKPMINANATSLSGKKVKSVENSLIMKGKRNKEKVESRREELEAKESLNCSFTPDITFKAKTSNARGYELLYEEAKKRAVRKQKLNQSIQNEECSFKPKINKFKSLNTSSMDRLLTNKKASFIQKEKQKQEEAAKLDPETGQAYFQPKVGRGPRRGRNPTNQLIGSHLYDQRSQTTSHAGTRVMQEPSKNQSEFQFVMQDNSYRILKKMKKDRFREIFMQLNPDESGQIVYQKINPDEIKPDVRKIIDPIIEELEALDQPLNFDEFFDAMERLLDTLNP